MMEFDMDAVDFAKADGLVPCIAQDHRTGRVLMLAYMDRAALEATLETGQVHYHSRSRGTTWRKGETSGHTQRLVGLRLDCDGDALLALVEQTGPACHTDDPTCFDARGDGPVGAALDDLWRVLVGRRANPVEGSHTTRLLGDENLRLKKVAEEAAEFVLAARVHDRGETIHEAADLLYHALAVLAAEGIDVAEVTAELARRRRPDAPA